MVMKINLSGIAIARLGNHEKDSMQIGNIPDAENEAALTLCETTYVLSCSGSFT